MFQPAKPEPEPVAGALADIPLVGAAKHCYLDHLGRLIFIGGDLDCRYEDFDVEERQMPRIAGATPLRG